MSAHGYVPGQTEGRRRAFLEWKSINYCKLSLIHACRERWKGLWKFAKFFMPFLTGQASFSSNFGSIFSAIKITTLYFFSSNIIYFDQKEQIFEIFECSGQNSSNSSCQFWNDKLIPLLILHHSSLLSRITPLYILSSYIVNFG